MYAEHSTADITTSEKAIFSKIWKRGDMAISSLEIAFYLNIRVFTYIDGNFTDRALRQRMVACKEERPKMGR